jgi:VCBS repeat-containing protein
VLANDSDVDDGHSFTLLSAAEPSGKGSVSVVANQLVFNPGAGFDHLAAGASETVTLIYTMRDEHGAESASTLSVTITGTNDVPVAVADTAAGTENQTLTIDVLASDSDVDDGHVLTLLSASASAGHGTVSIAGNQLVFNPGTDFDHLAAGATDTVTISYTLDDENGAESASTVTITITGTNDGPVANSDLATTDQITAKTIDVVANDTDPDASDVMTITNVSVQGERCGARYLRLQILATVTTPSPISTSPALRPISSTSLVSDTLIPRPRWRTRVRSALIPCSTSATGIR